MNRILVLAVPSLAGSGAFADRHITNTYKVYDGVMDGFEYSEMVKAAKWKKSKRIARLYVNGIVDGFISSSMYKAQDTYVRSIKTCVDIVGADQIPLMVEKYMDEHPIRWHLSMNQLVGHAITSECPNLKIGMGTS